MKKYSQVGKKLVIGFIALFLSMTLIPITGSQPIEKEQSIMMKGCSDGIILNGTMGGNGWYISPVVITFVDGNNRTFVKIDGGDWFEYTEPIVVDTEGFHEVWWYYIDSWGNQSSIYSVFFKIDMTPPTVTIIVLRKGCTIGVTVNASDHMSGVVLIEFYLDDSLVGFITTEPHEFIFSAGPGKHIVKVIVYDAAGLNASASVTTSYEQIDLHEPSLSTGITIHRIFFLGTLVNYSINETDFHLESRNLRIFEFGYYRQFGFLHLWGFSYYHYKAVIFSYNGYVDFHGILRPHFICGTLR